MGLFVSSFECEEVDFWFIDLLLFFRVFHLFGWLFYEFVVGFGDV